MMKKEHLYEIDFMRAFIMLGVLSVHTVTIFMGRIPDMTPVYMTLGALHTTMHYTRESFMFISGLVLFATYYRRENFSPLPFWYKRLTLIAVPYLVWNVIYVLFSTAFSSQADWSIISLWHVLMNSLLTGNQFYLYYVLVSIQLYIVFPVMLYWLRKWERRHVHILIGSFLLQLALMYYNKYPFIDSSHLPVVLRTINQYRDRFVLFYQFWFIAGGVMFCHYDKIRRFAAKHAKMIYWTVAAAVPLVWAHYFFDRLVLGQSESMGEMVLQPIMVPYSFLVTLLMWHAGRKWAERRSLPNWGLFNRFVAVASATSFGIFLIQPFPLALVRLAVNALEVPRWLYLCSIPFAILFVYLSGMLLAYWIGKAPIVAYCIGRKTTFSRISKNKASVQAKAS
jgi:hypothetical protein